MRFEYFGTAESTIVRLLGSLERFELVIEWACRTEDAREIGVRTLTPGLSGAEVFLLTRRSANQRLVPLVVKMCDDKKQELIFEELENYRERVKGVTTAVPALIDIAQPSQMLIYTYGGYLGSYRTDTLRSGYQSTPPPALGSLMLRVVKGIYPLHVFQDDTAPCTDRMFLLQEAPQLVGALDRTLQPNVEHMLDLWRAVMEKPKQSLAIRSTAHGDLNAGNILFEPGEHASYPVFIDFASMRQSKDNRKYIEYFHFPFWDYAKLERDLQTRLFLREALAERLPFDRILWAIVTLNSGSRNFTFRGLEPSIEKLFVSSLQLRAAIAEMYPLHHLEAYPVVLAYAMLTVLFREIPDGDVEQNIQQRVAIEASTRLLSLAAADDRALFPPIQLLDALDGALDGASTSELTLLPGTSDGLDFKVEGRNTQCDAICDVWLDPVQAHRHFVIHGAPNIGKTTLAQFVLSSPRVRRFFDGHTYQMRCDDLQTTDEMVRRIATLWFGSNRNPDASLQQAIVKGLAKQRVGILVDNFETFTRNSRPDVVRSSQRLLDKLAGEPNIWMLIGIQGNVRPQGENLTDAVMATPDPLSVDDCIRIFRNNCKVTGFGSDDEIALLLHQFGSQNTGYNPYAATLVARAVTTGETSFSDFYQRFLRRYAQFGTRILRGEMDSEYERERGIDFAYQFAFDSLPQPLQTQSALLLLAALPAGLSRDAEHDDQFLLADVQPVDGQFLDGEAIFSLLDDRALAYTDKRTQRIMLLDPLRDYLRTRSAALSSDLHSILARKRESVTNHYLNIALRSANLGGAGDLPIVSLVSREFVNTMWAVEQETERFRPSPASSRRWIKALYGISRFSNWTGRGRTESEAIIRKAIKNREDDEKFLGELYTILAESERMRESNVIAESHFAEAVKFYDADTDPGLQLINLIGMAECQRATFRIAQARENLLKAQTDSASLKNASSVVNIDRLWVGIHWRLAEVQRALYDFAEADRNYAQARELYIEREDWQGAASGLFGQATIKRMQMIFAEAVDLFQIAREDYKSDLDDATCSLGMAEARLANGAPYPYPEIESNLSRANRGFGRLDGFHSEIAWCSWGLGECQRHKGQYDNALLQLDDALNKLHGFEDSDCAFWCYWSMYLIADKTGEGRFRSADDCWTAFSAHLKPDGASRARAWKLRQMGDLAVQHAHFGKAEFLWSRSIDAFRKASLYEDARAVEAFWELTRRRLESRQSDFNAP